MEAQISQIKVLLQNQFFVQSCDVFETVEEDIPVIKLNLECISSTEELPKLKETFKKIRRLVPKGYGLKAKIGINF